MIVWLVLKPLGILSLLAGLVSLPTPLPIGAVLIVFGTGLLVMTSVTARRVVRSVRTLSMPADFMFARLEGRVGRRLGVPLRRTRPLTRRLRAPAPPRVE